MQASGEGSETFKVWSEKINLEFCFMRNYPSELKEIKTFSNKKFLRDLVVSSSVLQKMLWEKFFWEKKNM